MAEPDRKHTPGGSNPSPLDLRARRRDLQVGTPLHYAARMHWEAGVLSLLRYGADSNRRDGDGLTPFHYSLLFAQPRCVLSAFLLAGHDLRVEAGTIRSQLPGLGVEPETETWLRAALDEVVVPPPLQLLIAARLRRRLSAAALASLRLQRRLPPALARLIALESA